MDAKLAQNLSELCEFALKLGANAARTVWVPGVKVGAWTRMKCQYGCPSYGMTLCCPPYTPDYAAMARFLSEYEYGIIVEYVNKISSKSARAEHAVREPGLLGILIELEKQAFLKNYYRAFALSAGSCHLCEKCNLKKCVHPTEARPSLEACGIDVFALARDNGFEMSVFAERKNEFKIYGMVLVD